MKIQKVLFSSSDEYVDFWEPISKIFYEKLGIESVLIYLGDKHTPSEKYGKVIHLKPLTYPKLLQLLWSRIWFAKMEPNTTWLLGDIDLFPLQRNRFIDTIKDVSDDFHVHLGHNKISNPANLWQIKGPKDGGADLVSHYHVAKGHILDKNFELHDSFEESCKFLYENKYGLGFFSEGWNTDEKRHMCCCEQYTTEKMREKLNSINFVGFHYDFSQGMTRGDRGVGEHILKPYDVNILKSGGYIDFHSLRPYTQHKETVDEILNLAWKNK